MLTVYFSSTVSPEGATYTTAVHNVYSISLLKGGNCMVTLDYHHQSPSVEMLGGKDGVNRSGEALFMRNAFLDDNKRVSSARPIRLSVRVSASTAIERKKATPIDTIQSLLSYTISFEEDDGIRSVVMCKLEVVKSIMFS